MGKKPFIIIGTFLLIAIISVVGYSFSKRNTRTKTQAESPTTPFNVRTYDVTKDSFTVSWETKADFSGYIKYGTNRDELDIVATDIKGTYKFRDHTVKVINLNPSTNYFYVIISEEELYLDNNNPFQINTK